MAVASTYDGLKTLIATRAIRSDLTDLIPNFIAAAEERFNEEIRHPDMEEQATASIIDGTVTLPSDFLELASIYITPDGPMEQIGISALRGCYGEDVGEPRAFALQSGNEIVFGPAPDTDYDVVINYYRKIPALSDGNPSNWLLAAHSGLYLAASLAELFAHVVDGTRGAYWEGRTVQALAKLENSGRRKANSHALQTVSPSW